MTFEETGGQQLVGLAPEGRSGGPHFVSSGGEIGAARAKGSLPRVAATPYRPPPIPMRTFLLSNIPRFGYSWLSLEAVGGICGSPLPFVALHVTLET